MIPKIMHQVWIGYPETQLTEPEATWTNAAKDLNPDWEHRIWGGLEPELEPIQPLLDKCNNMSEKSDVIRWHVLYTIGGVYFDTDYEWLKPIGEFCKFGAFAGEYRHWGTNPHSSVMPTVFGCERGHEFARMAMELLEQRSDMEGNAGAKFGVLSDLVWCSDSYPHIQHPVTILPNSVIYPYGYEQAHGHRGWRCMKGSKAYGTHHWFGSWAGYLDLWNDRNGIIGIIKNHECKTVVEVGTFDSGWISDIARSTPGTQFYAVDKWEEYGDYSQEELNKAKNASMERASHLDNLTILEMDSVDASKTFDTDIDMVYIDANHSEEAFKRDLHAWAPKVRLAGVISGHYYTEGLGVKTIVDKFVELNKYSLQLTEEGEQTQSWAVIKQPNMKLPS